MPYQDFSKWSAGQAKPLVCVLSKLKSALLAFRSTIPSIILLLTIKPYLNGTFLRNQRGKGASINYVNKQGEEGG